MVKGFVLAHWLFHILQCQNCLVSSTNGRVCFRLMQRGVHDLTNKRVLINFTLNRLQQQSWCCYPSFSWIGGGKLFHHSGNSVSCPPLPPIPRSLWIRWYRYSLRFLVVSWTGSSVSTINNPGPSGLCTLDRVQWNRWLCTYEAIPCPSFLDGIHCLL